MAITRITQNMLSQRSLASLQAGLNRMAQTQEKLSTGRLINRPSDSPSGTVAAMRLRDTLAGAQQYQRNAQDGMAWLGTTDAALTSITDQARQARDIALQGANSGAMGQPSRDALAATVDQLRSSLIGTANTTYLGRPVFGGVTAGSEAYQDDGTTVSWVGAPGTVERTVGDGQKVRVDQDPTAVFGAAGDTIFEHLTALSDALRVNDQAAVRAGVGALNADLARLATSHAEMGTRYQRVESALAARADDELRLKASVSQVEDADLPQVIVDLQMQQASYQAALGATARVMQPSLMDFLR